MTDVNNAFVVDCIASYESYRFSAYTSGLKTMLQWLLNRNCKDICIESTGKYWLEELILALAAPYQQELAILQTAPGIRSDFTAIGIISEIGTNMEAFLSAKHLCSWAGLTPTNNESAGKKNLSGFPRPDAISNHCWFNVPTQQKASGNSQPLSQSQKASRSQESNHCHCKNASDCIISYAEER